MSDEDIYSYVFADIWKGISEVIYPSRQIEFGNILIHLHTERKQWIDGILIFEIACVYVGHRFQTCGRDIDLFCRQVLVTRRVGVNEAVEP